MAALPPAVQPPASPAFAHWVKLLWQRTVRQAAPTLQSHLDEVCFPANELVCQLCYHEPIADGIEEHFCSDRHIRYLHDTMFNVIKKNPAWMDNASGEHGCRVQKFYGKTGVAWFNHITGESGSDRLTERVHRWEKYSTALGDFWWDKQSEECFLVRGNFGFHLGLWR